MDRKELNLTMWQQQQLTVQEDWNCYGQLSFLETIENNSEQWQWI